jgi:hypothetical protein
MLISVVPIACIAAMFYGQSMEFWKGKTIKTNQQTLDAAVSIVDSRITMIEWDCALLADDPLVLTFMTNPTFNEVRRNRFITENLISMTEGYNKASWPTSIPGFRGSSSPPRKRAIPIRIFTISWGFSPIPRASGRSRPWSAPSPCRGSPGPNT